MFVNSQQEAELLAEKQPGAKLTAQLPTVEQPVEPAVKPPQPRPSHQVTPPPPRGGNSPPPLRRSPRKHRPVRVEDRPRDARRSPRRFPPKRRPSSPQRRRSPQRHMPRGRPHHRSPHRGDTGARHKRRLSPHHSRPGPRDSSTASSASGAKRFKVPVSINKKGQRMCGMSGCSHILTKRHAMHEHIPGILHDSQPLTEEVLTLRKTCLTICAKQVNHRPDIDALVRLVNLCGDVEAEELTRPRQLVPSQEPLEQQFPRFSSSNPSTLWACWDTGRC